MYACERQNNHWLLKIYSFFYQRETEKEREREKKKNINISHQQTTDKSECLEVSDTMHNGSIIDPLFS